jgi:hypothetical protein
MVGGGWSESRIEQDQWRNPQIRKSANPKSAIRNPQSEIRKSEIRNPKSTLRYGHKKSPAGAGPFYATVRFISWSSGAVC